MSQSNAIVKVTQEDMDFQKEMESCNDGLGDRLIAAALWLQIAREGIQHHPEYDTQPFEYEREVSLKQLCEKIRDLELELSKTISDNVYRCESRETPGTQEHHD